MTCYLCGCSVNEEVPGIFDDIPTLIGRASCVLLGLNIISEVVTGKVGATAGPTVYRRIL